LGKDNPSSDTETGEERQDTANIRQAAGGTDFLYFLGKI
jgi:hypothetical protein